MNAYTVEGYIKMEGAVLLCAHTDLVEAIRKMLSKAVSPIVGCYYDYIIVSKWENGEVAKREDISYNEGKFYFDDFTPVTLDKLMEKIL